MSVSIELNAKQIYQKVTNDKFGKALANEWARLIQPYVPRSTGQLMQNITLKPFEITYDSVYAHYMYEEILYVDPVTGSPWADFGKQKVPTGQNLTYRTNLNPFATDHWDKKAARAGQGRKLLLFANKYLLN